MSIVIVVFSVRITNVSSSSCDDHDFSRRFTTFHDVSRRLTTFHDVFSFQFVVAGQSVTLGEAVVRRYRPVSAENNLILLHIFSSDYDDIEVWGCGPNKLECYNGLSWKYLPVANTLAYWAHPQVTKKMKFCEYGPWIL